MRILIDADGCPVTMEAVKIGNEYGVESIIFATQATNLISIMLE